MKRILIIYYTQSGQLKQIADSLAGPLMSEGNIVVDYYRIKPVEDYPFPWPSDEFFDCMPESVQKVSIKLDLKDFPADIDYDLVILAYQVWYLSPAIPFSSFLKSEVAKAFLKGKKVITLLGVRNMWVMAQEYVRSVLKDYNAELVGNIVLADKAHNLVSVLTVIKWLIGGNKGPYNILPEAGVAEKDINLTSRFAEPIIKALNKNDYDNLQNELLELGAIDIKYHLVQMEKNAFRIFKIWARLIRKKGEAKNKKRLLRVRMFKYYLLFVIFVLSPLASIIFIIKRYLLYTRAKRQLEYYMGCTKHRNT